MSSDEEINTKLVLLTGVLNIPDNILHFMGTTGVAGNQGKGVRSDCQITLELTQSGGIQLDLNSKVQILFGEDIRQQVENMMDHFGVQHAKIKIDDSGALPLVIAARLEAALAQVMKLKEPFLYPVLPTNINPTSKEQNRFSRLYLPGNTPSLMINAGIHKPNGIILDLEDAVAPDKKDEARYLVRNALRGIDFYGAERMVRINQGERGLEDLAFVVPHHVNLILIPKCEEPRQIHVINERIDAIRQANNIAYDIWLMPIIESAKGVMNAFAIATAANNIASMAIGLEDYTADLGTSRTKEGSESFFARSMIVNAARAAGIQPIDSVFSDVGDTEGLKANVAASKALGFDGMGCIHPRQIAIIHEGFAPGEKEIEKAKKIVMAFDEAEKKGLGVVSLGTKMIDPPVVKRAIKTIQLAIAMNKLEENWRDSYEKI
jgi:citrate lyase subunit beta / citryl-CoA lyase